MLSRPLQKLLCVFAAGMLLWIWRAPILAQAASAGDDGPHSPVIKPIGISASPPTVLAGASFQLTVTLSTTVSYDRTVLLSTDRPDAFASLPESVLVPANSASGVTTAWTSTTEVPISATLSATFGTDQGYTLLTVSPVPNPEGVRPESPGAGEGGESLSEQDAPAPDTGGTQPGPAFASSPEDVASHGGSSRPAFGSVGAPPAEAGGEDRTPDPLDRTRTGGERRGGAL